MHAVGRAFEGKRVFVTGHTGFKGSWLCEWLLLLGADVRGFSLPPATQPALFSRLGLERRLDHGLGDVRDPAALETAINETQPDYVFHLAAQPLVRLSYAQPLETFATNIMGTAHLCSALGSVKKPCAVVVVTSDKCYENHEEGRSYQEGDSLGGRDPYSASKAGSEIVAAAWRNSYYPPVKIAAGLVPPIAIAIARAGNVIGGGDWAPDRIVPDCLRALARGENIHVRNPSAVRPWQHVLEPLSGYLILAAQLHAALTDSTRPGRLAELCSPFNFGPEARDHRTVKELVEEVLKHSPGQWEDSSDPAAVHEAHLLHLATDKARQQLGWRPRWSFAQAVEKTVVWHRAPDADGLEITRQQIGEYTATASP